MVTRRLWNSSKGVFLSTEDGGTAERSGFAGTNEILPLSPCGSGRFSFVLREVVDQQLALFVEMSP
jgi:hypothetical protein